MNLTSENFNIYSIFNLDFAGKNLFWRSYYKFENNNENKTEHYNIWKELTVGLCILSGMSVRSSSSSSTFLSRKKKQTSYFYLLINSLRLLLLRIGDWIHVRRLQAIYYSKYFRCTVKTKQKSKCWWCISLCGIPKRTFSFTITEFVKIFYSNIALIKKKGCI